MQRRPAGCVPIRQAKGLREGIYCLHVQQHMRDKIQKVVGSHRCVGRGCGSGNSSHQLIDCGSIECGMCGAAALRLQMPLASQPVDTGLVAAGGVLRA